MATSCALYILFEIFYNILGLLPCGALRQLGTGEMPEEGAKVPAWNGDPSSFEQFVQDCMQVVWKQLETVRTHFGGIENLEEFDGSSKKCCLSSIS